MTEYMNALIAQMRYIAFASIALALTFDYGIYREIGFKRICYMIALIAAIASYNTIVDTGTEMFASAKENARTEYYTTMRSVRQAIDNGKKEASWFERNILITWSICCWGFAMCSPGCPIRYKDVLSCYIKCAVPLPWDSLPGAPSPVLDSNLQLVHYGFACGQSAQR